MSILSGKENVLVAPLVNGVKKGILSVKKTAQFGKTSESREANSK